jgi:hypothetical protein
MDHVLKYVVLLLVTLISMALVIFLAMMGTGITFSGALHASLILYALHVILKGRDTIQATLDIERESEQSGPPK